MPPWEGPWRGGIIPISPQWHFAEQNGQSFSPEEEPFELFLEDPISLWQQVWD